MLGDCKTNAGQSNALSKAILDRTRFCKKFLKDRIGKKQKTTWDYLESQNLNTSLILHKKRVTDSKAFSFFFFFFRKTTFTKIHFYNSNITIAITTRSSLFKLFLKLGAHQRHIQNNCKISVKEFIFQPSCSQEAGNFTKENNIHIFKSRNNYFQQKPLI